MQIAIHVRQPQRLGPLALTVLAHVALLLAWQTARTPPAAPDSPRRAIQWIWLPVPQAAEPTKPARATAPSAPAAPVAAPDAGATLHVRRAAPAADVSPAISRPLPAPAETPSGTPPAAVQPETPIAATPGPSLLERARKQAGAVDRALRKENNAYIAAPLDSPQMRMRKGMEEAARMAPNALYEAPKIEELVNNTGDGARRTRVITGNGTYCLTERAPTTSVDMIEKHGKRWPPTNCPAHETPANPQAWRTLRD